MVGSAEGQGSVLKQGTLATIDGLSIFKPPYARVTAIDMKKGEHLWVAPLGNGPRDHPLLKGLNVPPMGAAYWRGSVLVTKSLLFVAVSRVLPNGSRDPQPWEKWADPDEEQNVIYVFDKKSGAILRQVDVGSTSAGAPMTYLYEGKQYIVVAIGSGPTSELVALSLP